MRAGPIDYYFTVTSPWSYIGHLPFLKLAAASGRAVAFKPVDFGKVFAQSGGLPLPQRPVQRRRYRMFELQRWRDFRGTELNLRPAHFPTDPSLGNRMTMIAADQDLDAGALGQAIMRACWFEEKNVADEAVLIAAADGLGLDGKALLSAAKGAAGIARAEELTEEAIAGQVFGAPTYVIDGEPFWGQDRLELVERALQGRVEPYKVEGAV